MPSEDGPGTVISLTPPAWSRIRGGFADPGVTEFLKERGPICRVVIVGMAAAVLGLAVGSVAVWALRRAGEA